MKVLAAASLLVAVAACRKPVCPVAPKPAPTLNDGGSISSRVFVRLRELAGTWSAGDQPVAFDVQTKGAAIVQRSGFFVVWFVDGPALGASLFSDDGSHTRMRSTKIVEGAELTIEMARVEAGNVGDEPALVSTVAMTVSSQSDRITQRWVFEGGGEPAKPLELVMTRGAPPAPVVPPPS